MFYKQIIGVILLIAVISKKLNNLRQTFFALLFCLKMFYYGFLCSIIDNNYLERVFQSKSSQISFIKALIEWHMAQNFCYLTWKKQLEVMNKSSVCVCESD